MTTINYTPKNGPANPTNTTKPAAVALKEAVQTALDADVLATRQAARAVELSFANASWTGDNRYAFGRMPVAGTVVSIHWVAKTNASAAGTVVGSINGGANALQSANIDLKTGINDTLKAASLTATAAHLTLAAGALLAATATGSTVTGGAGLTCIVTYTPT